jgi:hypothetical protein
MNIRLRVLWLRGCRRTGFDGLSKQKTPLPLAKLKGVKRATVRWCSVCLGVVGVMCVRVCVCVFCVCVRAFELVLCLRQFEGVRVMVSQPNFTKRRLCGATKSYITFYCFGRGRKIILPVIC